ARRVEIEVDHARMSRQDVRAAVADYQAVLARRDLAQYLHLALEQIPVRVVPKRRRRVWRLWRAECEAAEESLPERRDALAVRLKRRRVNAERLSAQVQDLSVYVPESESLRDPLSDVRAAAPHPPRDGHSRPRFHTDSLRPPASNPVPATPLNLSRAFSARPRGSPSHERA